LDGFRFVFFLAMTLFPKRSQIKSSKHTHGPVDAAQERFHSTARMSPELSGTCGW
jgi:hypothetical protein